MNVSTVPPITIIVSVFKFEKSGNENHYIFSTGIQRIIAHWWYLVFSRTRRSQIDLSWLGVTLLKSKVSSINSFSKVNLSYSTIRLVLGSSIVLVDWLIHPINSLWRQFQVFFFLYLLIFSYNDTCFFWRIFFQSNGTFRLQARTCSLISGPNGDRLSGARLSGIFVNTFKLRRYRSIPFL